MVPQGIDFGAGLEQGAVVPLFAHTAVEGLTVERLLEHIEGVVLGLLLAREQ